MGGGSVKWVADLHLLHFLHHAVDEHIVDGILDEQPTSGDAILTLIEKYGSHGYSDGLFQISIGENDQRRFSSQFQRDFLDVGNGRRMQNLLPHLGGTGKTDLSDIRMIAKCLANLGPRSRDDVDDRVACSQTRRRFPRQHHQRIIPWDYNSTDSQRFSFSKSEVHVGFGVVYGNRFSLDFVAPSSKIPKRCDRHSDMRFER